MGFTRAELESFRDAVIADLIGPDCRLLFVGINPGLWTAATGAHFARPGNRFYPALYRAGIVDRVIDASAGMKPEDRDLLIERGVGITNMVHRATARADELSADEFREGAAELVATVERVAPRVVAVAGITAYRMAFGEKKAAAGRQDRRLGDSAISDAEVWVVPNPSGLNAHHTVDTLAQAYREAALAAGVV
ncbi:G/U mismatch-specific uracil-DNA glycosylase [Williamsia limnetica]|jgi:TDG/mug DNA glycosylase family protein|uniref:G/U mismatch-specific uracil-DNA glycosylase n=1 Tax=Williamsia limnetica TaxID=882452 RepID=A0A318RKX9_WILLI|nr:G/U mismatch-specific DNA glycosylase [Williamsia limnetica]PYE18699.1 G/U mismatch-specific uracil-DNA glycosylase [Williamsia limnetica]